MSETHDDDATAAAASGLSTDAERTLLQQRARFLAWVERQVGSAAVAEELLQSAMLRAVERGIPTEDPDGTVHWFYRVLRNAVIDHHRSREVETRALDREKQSSPGEAVEPELREAICQCMREVLPALKPEYAHMVQRVDLDEVALGEVAKEVGITANNAAVRLHRARQALRRQLQRVCGACSEHACLECSCGSSRASLVYERP